jgi:hypothetical protein
VNPSSPRPRSHPTPAVARGTFAVTLGPEPVHEAAADTGLGRLSIAKRFEGDLVGSSRGEMLSLMTTEEGSAGYVAIERVTGTLAGRSGTFALQHSGLMDRGSPRLTVTVIPGSGTGGLAGLSGTFEIEIDDDGHRYALAWALPD